MMMHSKKDLESKMPPGVGILVKHVPDGLLLSSVLGLDDGQKIAHRYWMKDGKYYTEFRPSSNLETTPEDYELGHSLLPHYGFGNLREVTKLYQDRYQNFRPHYGGLMSSIVEVPEAEALFDIAALVLGSGFDLERATINRRTMFKFPELVAKFREVVKLLCQADTGRHAGKVTDATFRENKAKVLAELDESLASSHEIVTVSVKPKSQHSTTSRSTRRKGSARAMRDELFLRGKTNLLGPLEENLRMVAEVQYQGSSGSGAENKILLRIGVPQKRPMLSELSEISLALTVDQAGELAGVLIRYAVENEFPEGSVCFEFKGDNSKRVIGAPVAYVKRRAVSERLPVAAQLTRTESVPNESSLTMALEAPKQGEDGVWHAEVCVSPTEARQFGDMILVNIDRLKGPD
jgi:hypothetical protein